MESLNLQEAWQTSALRSYRPVVQHERFARPASSVKDISDLTGFPEILDGRVKTLHPKVHGGLLGIRDNPNHQRQMAEQQISPIDLVVVNLYPFEETAAKPGIEFDEVIENIDIGGPSMIRSAAKNFRDVGVVVDPADYDWVLEELKQNPVWPLARVAI